MSNIAGSRTSHIKTVPIMVQVLYVVSNAHNYGLELMVMPQTAGAGFGNKTSDDPAVDGDDTRFGIHAKTDSYSGGTHHGSGSTGGAGFGNKTSEMGKEDSMVGKVMEKIGGMMNNEQMVEKGRAKRETNNYGDNVDPGSE